MFGLPNPYILIGAGVLFLVSNALSGWAGHTVTHNAWEAAQAKVLEQQASQRVADETRLNDLSAQLETAKAKRDVVTRTITKKVDRLVTVYRDRACLDDAGVQLLNAAIAGQSADPGQSPGSMPSGRSSGERDSGGGAPQGGRTR